MIHYLLLAVGAPIATPAIAQKSATCPGIPADQVAASTDRPTLEGDADCLWRAAIAATVARQARLDRLASLPAMNPTPLLVGQLGRIASGLNVARLLGPKRIPPGGAPDVVGAFPSLCGPGQVLPDDPNAYPGQPGRAHLHQFFGNLGTNARSTYASLGASGSTCQNELNRSAYWMPAMLDGRGNAVRPGFVLPTATP